ncbi:MAG: 5'/3'-nucleotidase SurE [Desulfobacterales bacterium]|nr:MAG: 5'/3'-nucleotidase SurE [Desulfobacterales bacterium]
MNVLLTNDDGIYAEGLWALYNRLAKGHQVSVVAPDRERSAIGHAITLHQPLRAARFSLNGEYGGYAVNGTPADCIKLGILEILPTRPDVVVSGINPGANVGANLNYSGTVAAAKEAALCGTIGIAVSIVGPIVEFYDDAALFVARLSEAVYKRGLPFGTFLNVNLPNLPLKKIAGVRISRQGVELLSDYVEKRLDPRNRTYYWQGEDRQSFGNDPQVDGVALAQNFISITPVKCDMTDYSVMENLASWGLDEWLG